MFCTSWRSRSSLSRRAASGKGSLIGGLSGHEEGDGDGGATTDLRFPGAEIFWGPAGPPSILQTSFLSTFFPKLDCPDVYRVG